MTMHWSNGWGLVAQILVLWIIAAAISAPQIGRYLRNRRTNDEFRALLPRDPMKYEGRDLTPIQKAAIETPERRRLYREAEKLGFLDSDDLPRRSA